jgi:LytS/YehU family sensor histidine kinase
VKLPALLIQPLVENSIRHAVAPKLGEGHVWVHARVHGERCTIVVQDDGDGTKHPSTGTGFGLRSVQQRLELVYGGRFSFAISQRGGYRVEVEVPHEAAAPPG